MTNYEDTEDGKRIHDAIEHVRVEQCQDDTNSNVVRT